MSVAPGGGLACDVATSQEGPWRATRDTPAVGERPRAGYKGPEDGLTPSSRAPGAWAAAGAGVGTQGIVAACGLGRDCWVLSGLGFSRYSGGAFPEVPGPRVGYHDCPVPLEGTSDQEGLERPAAALGRGGSPGALGSDKGEEERPPLLQSLRTLVPPLQQAHVSYFWNLYSTAGGMPFHFSRFCFAATPPPFAAQDAQSGPSSGPLLGQPRAAACEWVLPGIQAVETWHCTHIVIFLQSVVPMRFLRCLQLTS